MCGIAGAVVYRDVERRLFFDAVAACRERGEDSFGLVRWAPSAGWKEQRSPRPPGDFAAYFDDGCPLPHFYVHTSRAEPTTEYLAEKTPADIPPFRNPRFAVAHNGIIANDRELAAAFDLRRMSAIDTSILPALLDRLGFARALRELKGGQALAIIDARGKRLHLARNFLPLTVAWRPGLLAFASEARFFRGADGPFPPFRVWRLPPFSAIEFSAEGFRGPVAWGEAPAGAWQAYPEC